MQPPLQLPLHEAPLLLGVDEPPATAWAKVDMRRLVLRLLHLGQAIFSTGAVLRMSFSNDTPHWRQSYSKIGMGYFQSTCQFQRLLRSMSNCTSDSSGMPRVSRMK